MMRLVRSWDSGREGCLTAALCVVVVAMVVVIAAPWGAS